MKVQPVTLQMAIENMRRDWWRLTGDRTRLTIVAILKQRDCCVCELNEVFDMSQPFWTDT